MNKLILPTIAVLFFVFFGYAVYRNYTYPSFSDYASSATIVHTCLGGTYDQELLDEIAMVHKACRKELHLDRLQCDVALCHYLQDKFDVHPLCGDKT